MVNNVDVVVGLAWGDEAKGKVANQLASGTTYCQDSMSEVSNYDYVARWNGGSNAGHTIYIGDDIYKTHIVPCGIFHGIKSIIGPNCVLNKESFLKELSYLEKSGFDTSLVKVAPNTHIVKSNHIEYDKSNLASKLGTTSSGIAPAYADKAARCGVLAVDALDEKYIWDGKLSGNVLCEGAQGVWLDINHGNYPYVTSSETLPYGSCSLGFPTQKIRNIYGVAKIYDTRSGEDPDFPNSLLEEPLLEEIGVIGKEYGVTTGRRRKVNWLNFNKLIRSINISGSNIVIINKCDVLDDLGACKIYYNDELLTFVSLDDAKDFIKFMIDSRCDIVDDIIFSSTPHGF